MMKTLKRYIGRKMRAPVWYQNRSFLADHAEYFKGEVIDLGCDRTKYKSFILSVPGVTSYLGVDFYRTEKVDEVVDLNKPLPFENDRFGAAISISVMEHLLEPQIFLDETGRILKSGGYFFISTPWIFPYHGEPYDYFRYSRAALEYMLGKAGFEIVYCATTGGKTRILANQFLRWLPRFGKLKPLIERWLLVFKTNRQAYNEIAGNNLSTPSHHVIARKK